MEALKLGCDYFLILIKNFESLNTEVQTNKYRKKGQFATKYCSKLFFVFSDPFLFGFKMFFFTDKYLRFGLHCIIAGHLI